MYPHYARRHVPAGGDIAGRRTAASCGSGYDDPAMPRLRPSFKFRVPTPHFLCVVIGVAIGCRAAFAVDDSRSFEAKVREAIARLDSADFASREKAAEDLADLLPDALPVL